MVLFRSSVVAAVVFLSASASSVGAFQTIQKAPISRQYVTTTTSTQLNVVPPLIIGNAIKKMREEQAKKSMPMADASEAAREAPGLRVGREVWKWPPVWPYDDARYFVVKSDEDVVGEAKNSLTEMASMISGSVPTPQVVDAEKDSEEAEKKKLDPLEYWGSQPSSTSIQDPEVIEKIKTHFSFYLQDGISILEFGAAENSYLPDDLKTTRHVGVGANMEQMNQNKRLTEKLVVNLNKVVKDRDVDSDDLRRLASSPDEQFDVIIMANTAECLTSPREVFRTAWYLLKPGGLMIVPFLGKEASKDMFTEGQTKIWREYNDDQHMWITGSFFQFSAGDGWENLLGFDISPDSVKERSQLEKIVFGAAKNRMYVVQATKGFQYDKIEPTAVKESINSLCWMLPTLEERDKGLLLPRLARAYETASSTAIKDAIERNLSLLPVIYESLIKMDTFSFTFSMQAQMAADLICDPDFDANEQQILNLKQGLGLRTPSKEFWVPIGQLTGAMEIEDRISLLAYIVPRFGGNKQATTSLQAFVTGLEPTYKVIKSKCPKMSDSDVQLLGTELLAVEILTPGRATVTEFAYWMDALTADELEAILQDRQALRKAAKQDYEAFVQAKKEEQARIDEYKQKYEEQIQTARLERSLIFNPKTQKMQIFDNPNKKEEKKPWYQFN